METKRGHVVVVGYGDVGKSIVTELLNAGVEFIVVDKNEDALVGRGFDYVAGDGSNEEVLMRAGVAYASTVIIALNTDTDTIFATLVARTLAPDAIILARANAPVCGKIYKAGADYVASLSIVVGQMIAKLAISEQKEDVVMLYEGIAIEKYHVKKGSPFAEKTLEELDLRSKVGCTVIAIEKDGKTIIDLHGNTVIGADSILAIVGSREQIRKFEEYEHRRPESPERIMIEKIGELFR
ncbi:MAG TPA: TrkA family potassium uptake protein [Methanosarcinales archaeon]|nr:TrkA family potassium uptake protein [Methanosarcinales archaeon]